jgi:hypothetical protein
VGGSCWDRMLTGTINSVLAEEEEGIFGGDAAVGIGRDGILC